MITSKCISYNCSMMKLNLKNCGTLWTGFDELIWLVSFKTLGAIRPVDRTAGFYGEKTIQWEHYFLLWQPEVDFGVLKSEWPSVTRLTPLTLCFVTCSFSLLFISPSQRLSVFIILVSIPGCRQMRKCMHQNEHSSGSFLGFFFF